MPESIAGPASTTGRLKRAGINVGKGCFRGDVDVYYVLSSGCSSSNGVTLEIFLRNITFSPPDYFLLLAKETSVSMYRKSFRL